MIELKTPKEIEAMKPAGRFVGGILHDLKEFTKVGTNLLEIDEFVHKRIVDRKGASSCYVDYAPDFGTGPFAHYICTSVNDAVLHGVPYDYNLKDGDLVSSIWRSRRRMGRGFRHQLLRRHAASRRPAPDQVHRRGFGGRHRSRSAGQSSGRRLLRRRRRGTRIRLPDQPGVRRARRRHIMHGDPHVPNDGKAHHGYKLRPGLVIAIEPWFLKTTDEIYQDPKDGWTLKSEDAPVAHTASTPSPSPKTVR